MNLTRIRRLGAAVAAAITLIAAGGAAAPALAAPAAPQSGWYYALGDSYAAGVGGGALIPDGTLCGRTYGSYPADLGAKKNIGCAGATTADVIQQARTIPTNTGYVTVTVGANDLGLDKITAACLAADPNNPLTWSTCLGQLAAAQGQLGTVAANIPAIIAAIRAKSPNAQIVFTGYPHLFLAGLSPLTDQVNAGIDALNATIWAAATGAGAHYVPVSGIFTGHEIGSLTPWINGPGAGAAAFHPNAAGYLYGYKPLVGAALGLPVPALVG
ncbi:SGNH/GDSL hydrolase family protein [Sinomonas notoginsengisoli]|uniref:GDSL-type esterase/lipase family protein n=1 Tax=Sinomonas notoginsengisoli TaxID=1457311 RepID=UPI001F407054|nr:GDSL-type esterase/lipase family protein [Sinomonas notoginsengisoli]